MSLRYLLDGYNIVHQMPGLYLKELEEQRKGLICFIESHQPQGSLNNSVTIYFDGKSGYGSYLYSSHVKVIFSKDESADNLIKKTVQDAKNKKTIVVVTNDREIQCFVSAQGANVLTVGAFLKESQSAKGKKSSTRRGQADTKIESNAKAISKTAEFKINQELKDIWIKRKKKRLS